MIFTAPQTVGYEELALGPLRPREVLVRVTASGISHGTEMSAFLGTQANHTKKISGNRIYVPKTPDDAPAYPFRYAGYEAVGRVEAVGDEVREFQAGDRVWFPAQHQTAFVFDVSDTRALRLPAEVSDEQAILIHLTMVALNAVLDAQVKSGDVVAIFGGGTVGQLAARIALHDGASKVFLSEPLAERRSIASRITGIEPIDPTIGGSPAQQILDRNDGRPPEVVIECSGVVAALHQAIQASGLAGTVIAAGMYAGPATALNLSEEFLTNRVTIKASMGVWGCPSRHAGWDLPRLLRESLRLIAIRAIDVSNFVTARVPFAEAQRAYALVRDEPQRHLKVMLTYA